MVHREGPPKPGYTGQTQAAELTERLARSDGSPAQLLANTLAVQCLLNQAENGAILRYTDGETADVLAVYPDLKERDSAPAWLSKSAGSVREVLSRGEAAFKPLASETQPEGRSSKRHILLLPLPQMAGEGTVAVFVFENADKAQLQEARRRIELVFALFSSFNSHQARQKEVSGMKRLQDSMSTLSAINRHSKLTVSAMEFCNELASRLRCERVSIGFLKNRYVRVKAISHIEHFNRKMESVQELEAVMEECLDQDVEVLHPPAEEASYVNRTVAHFSARYGPVSVLSMPLRRGGEPFAVVTLERSTQDPFTLEEIETTRLTCELCTARLHTLNEHDRWFGAKAATSLRKGFAALLGPKHTWAKVVALALFAAILFATFGKGQFRPKAEFVLEATQKQVVPAPFDGYLKKVNVEVGDTIKRGETVLAELKTDELRLKLASAKADKVRYLKQRAAAMRDGKTAEAQIAEANADKAQAQIDLYKYRINQASLISPISGTIVKGDLKRKIGGPVQTGDVLFELTPLRSLRAELHVPEDLIAEIKERMKGQLATASFPGRRIDFVVERIEPKAEVINQRNVVKVRATLNETYRWMRPGMEGVAKVNAGPRRYIWIWTRKVVNWIRMKLWI